MKADRDVFYLQYFVAFWLSLYFDHERRLIDTTAPYVNIFICHGQQLKYLFWFTLKLPLSPRNA